MGLRTRAGGGAPLWVKVEQVGLSGGDGWSRGGVQVCVASTCLCAREGKKSEIRAFDWTDKADLANASLQSDGEKGSPIALKMNPSLI